jgi:hypothetical protein
MIYDLELSPAENARTDIETIMKLVGRFVSSRDNGINPVENYQVQEYLNSVIKTPAELICLMKKHDHYFLELEIGFVNAKCKVDK